MQCKNIYFNGSYTGEVNVCHIRNMGINTVIVGHSERRKNFCESNELINSKIKVCLENNLRVVLCIGETKEDKIEPETNMKGETVQLSTSANNITADIHVGSIKIKKDDKYVLIKNATIAEFGETGVQFKGTAYSEDAADSQRGNRLLCRSGQRQSNH